MAAKRRSSTAVAAVVIAVAGACGFVGAAPVDIVSNVADYEPRLEEPTAGSGSFVLNNIDDLTTQASQLGTGNIDIPTDAAFLRVGGQGRHKMNGALFFPLPESSGVASIAGAHLRMTQIATGGTPVANADLWAVGVYSNISTANDFDDPQVHDTIANGSPDNSSGLAGMIYLEADAETNLAGLNTSVPRQRIADNFLTPSEAIITGGEPAVRETNAAADTALVSYLNNLYASTTIGPNTYLVLRLNPDATVSSTEANQYRFASADDPDLADRPTLTLDVIVPEPASTALLGVATVTLLARRRRH